MKTRTPAEQALDNVRVYMRQHNLTPYAMAMLAGIPKDRLYGILDNPKFWIDLPRLVQCERAIMDNPHPVTPKRGRPKKQPEAAQ